MPGDSQCTWNGDMVPCSVLGFVARTQKIDHFQIISRDPLFAAGFYATVRTKVNSRATDPTTGEEISPWSQGEVIDSVIYGLPQPQDVTVGTKDVTAYRGRIEKMLQNKDCANFIQNLLDEAKALTGQPYSNILTTFDQIRFFWGEGTSRAHFDHGVPAATIRNTIITERPSGSLANQNDRRAFLISQTTQSFLGETLHHVGQGFAYSDGVMANAMNAILVRQRLDEPQAFSDKTETDTHNASGYWHPKVWDACPAPRK